MEYSQDFRDKVLAVKIKNHRNYSANFAWLSTKVLSTIKITKTHCLQYFKPILIIINFLLPYIEFRGKY